MGGNRNRNIPFIFKFIPQLEDLDLNLALTVMLQDLLVWLSLPVLQAVEVGGVWFTVVAGTQVREVTLDET